MSSTQFEAIQYDVADLDAALVELAIETTLSIETQRSLAGRVLLTSSLAAAISDEAEYEAAVAELGDLPVEVEHLEFFIAFTRGLVQDMREGMGDEGAQIKVLTRRMDAFAVRVLA